MPSTRNVGSNVSSTQSISDDSQKKESIENSPALSFMQRLDKIGHKIKSLALNLLKPLLNLFDDTHKINGDKKSILYKKIAALFTKVHYHFQPPFSQIQDDKNANPDFMEKLSTFIQVCSDRKNTEGDQHKDIVPSFVELIKASKKLSPEHQQYFDRDLAKVFKEEQKTYGQYFFVTPPNQTIFLELIQTDSVNSFNTLCKIFDSDKMLMQSLTNKDANGFTPLMHACLHGNTDIIKAIFKHVTSLEKRDDLFAMTKNQWLYLVINMKPKKNDVNIFKLIIKYMPKKTRERLLGKPSGIK